VFKFELHAKAMAAQVKLWYISKVFQTFVADIAIEKKANGSVKAADDNAPLKINLPQVNIQTGNEKATKMLTQQWTLISVKARRLRAQFMKTEAAFSKKAAAAKSAEMSPQEAHMRMRVLSQNARDAATVISMIKQELSNLAVTESNPSARINRFCGLEKPKSWLGGLAAGAAGMKNAAAKRFAKMPNPFSSPSKAEAEGGNVPDVKPKSKLPKMLGNPFRKQPKKFDDPFGHPPVNV